MSNDQKWVPQVAFLKVEPHAARLGMFPLPVAKELRHQLMPSVEPLIAMFGCHGLLDLGFDRFQIEARARLHRWSDLFYGYGRDVTAR